MQFPAEQAYFFETLYAEINRHHLSLSSEQGGEGMLQLGRLLPLLRFAK